MRVLRLRRRASARLPRCRRSPRSRLLPSSAFASGSVSRPAGKWRVRSDSRACPAVWRFAGRARFGAVFHRRLHDAQRIVHAVRYTGSRSRAALRARRRPATRREQDHGRLASGRARAHPSACTFSSSCGVVATAMNTIPTFGSRADQLPVRASRQACPARRKPPTSSGLRGRLARERTRGALAAYRRRVCEPQAGRGDAVARDGDRAAGSGKRGDAVVRGAPKRDEEIAHWIMLPDRRACTRRVLAAGGLPRRVASRRGSRCAIA